MIVMLNRCFKRINTILLMLLTVSFMIPLAASAAEKEIVRVGYYDVGDYFRKDANGKLAGYDVEYLKEIAAYTGLDFEYVYCGTWMNAVRMLKNREIDLVGATQWNEEREQEYEFCLEKYGYAIGEIVVLPENGTIYEDYAAINKMKIGRLYNYIHTDALQRLFDAKHLTPQIITFDTQRELAAALSDGTVDAIASNSHIVRQDLRVIEKFYYAPYYFISWKGNTELTDKLDKAISRINIEKPSFDDNLLRREFPKLENTSLNKEEQEYIASVDSLTLAFCTNEGYLCRTEDGQYVGINPAIARRACEMLGVEYREVQFDFPQLIRNLSAIGDGQQSAVTLVDAVKSMGIDVWGDFYYDREWADTLGVGMTDPYMEATYYMIQTRGTVIHPETCRVAAVRGLRYTSEIVNQYAKEQIVWCDDFESCIKAVKDGRADMTVINTLAAEYYLSMFQYSGLSSTLIDFKNQSAMATISDKNGLLASALSKTIKSISEDDMDALIRNETMKQPQQDLLLMYFYTHTATAVTIILVLAVGVTSLAAMFYIIRKSRQKNELLLRATNAKSDFLAKMSHDIRTPMNAIINMTNMVEEEIDDKEAALRDIQKIKTSNEFLLSLINDVLDVSRIEQGKMVLNRQVYNDADFVDYMHSTFDSLCRSKNIEFTLERGEYNVVVMTDKVRFNQICFNIVSNAIKYTPDGGHVTLRLVYQPVRNGYLPLDLYVIDDGIGMSRDFIKHAFESFEQENRQYMTVEGTGLGLSIVKEIVKLMKGEVKIDSEVGRGTTVHVHLDLEVADPALTEPVQAEQREAALNMSILRGKTVLVVEDHPLNKQIITQLLEKQEMTVLDASNGAEAIDVFKEHCRMIDVILMDIRMPVMNGLEAAEAIRQLGCANAATTPIIAMTANAYEEDVQKSLKAGMNEHLAKPINADLLYKTLVLYLSKEQPGSGRH